MGFLHLTSAAARLRGGSMWHFLRPSRREFDGGVKYSFEITGEAVTDGSVTEVEVESRVAFVVFVEVVGW